MNIQLTFCGYKTGPAKSFKFYKKKSKVKPQTLPFKNKVSFVTVRVNLRCILRSTSFYQASLKEFEAKNVDIFIF